MLIGQRRKLQRARRINRGVVYRYLADQTAVATRSRDQHRLHFATTGGHTRQIHRLLRGILVNRHIGDHIDRGNVIDRIHNHIKRSAKRPVIGGSIKISIQTSIFHRHRNLRVAMLISYRSEL